MVLSYGDRSRLAFNDNRSLHSNENSVLHYAAVSVCESLFVVGPPVHHPLKPIEGNLFATHLLTGGIDPEWHGQVLQPKLDNDDR